jgi:hypothetical protein
MTTILDIDVTSEQVPLSVATIYTATATAANFESSKLNGGVVYNSSSTDVNFTLYVVKLGDGPATANKYFDGVIHAGRADLLSQVVGANLTLNSGDTIQVFAGAIDSLNLKLSLTEKYT